MTLIPENAPHIKPVKSVLKKALHRYADNRAFLVWRAIDDGEGNFSKMPVDPADGVSRAPNSATERSVLTFQEAVDAAERLRAQDIPCGVGMLARKAGIIAIDIDDCVKVNGVAKIDQWALDVIGGNYAEWSPSRTGLRCLVTAEGLDPELLARANGHERVGLGLYGPHANKFVTLTGQVLDGAEQAISPLSPDQQSAIWKRWSKAPKLDNSLFVSSYPPGEHGRNLAIEDIVTGASLHPATVAYVASAANVMARSLIENILHEAYQESDAREADPGRWNDRYPKSIEGAIEWVGKREGFKVREPVPEQKRQGAKGFVENFKATKEARAEAIEAERIAELDPYEAEIEKVRSEGRLAYRFETRGNRADTGYESVATAWIPADEYFELSEHWGFDAEARLSEETADDIDKFRIYMANDKGRDTPGDLHDSPVLIRLREERAAEEALEELRTGDDGLQGDLAPWMVEDIPSEALKRLAEHVLARQAYDMPPLAALSALMAVSVLAQNAFAVQWRSYATPLNLYAIGVGPSGAGKEAGRELVGSVGHMVGENTVSGKVASEAGLYDALIAAGRTGKVVLWDEIWSLFAKLGQPQSTHEQGMIAVLLESYNKGTGQIGTTALSASNRNQRPPILYAPALSFYGTTTPRRLFKAITDDFLEDGLVGRTMFVRSPRGPEKPLTYQGPVSLPDDIREALRHAAGAFRHVGASMASPKEGTLDPRLRWSIAESSSAPEGRAFIRIEIGDRERARIAEWASTKQGEFPDTSAMSAVASRATTEQVIRIAAICAVGKVLDEVLLLGDDCVEVLNRRGVSIDGACIDYATRVVGHLLDDLGSIAGQFSGGDTPAERSNQKIRQKITRAILEWDTIPLRKQQASAWRKQLKGGWVTTACLSYITTDSDARAVESVMNTLITRGDFAGLAYLPRDLLPEKLKDDKEGSKRWPQGWQYTGGFVD